MHMGKLSATFPTAITFAFTGIAVAYFVARFLVRRKFSSLAIVFMSTGWAVCAAVMNGTIDRAYFNVVEIIGMLVSFFLVVSLFSVEFWQDYRRTLDERAHAEEEDRRLRERGKEDAIQRRPRRTDVP